MVSPKDFQGAKSLPVRLRRESIKDAAEPHRVLGVSRHETDPVQIILAAQIRLRRWRRLDPADMSAQRRRRVHEIVGAREAMMRRAMMRLAVLASSEPLGRTV